MSIEHHRLPNAVALLQRLIAVPSPSREESATADIWENWLREEGAVETKRIHNNVYAVAPGYDPAKPVLMLNSHHDTVRPAASWSRDPFSPDIVETAGERRLYGLGSNDAGASGVALASTYLDLRENPGLPFNLILAITAAEEVMGEHGMRAFLPHLAVHGLTPDMVIVGEPTSMQPAIAERGLLVFDCETRGISGHAARNEGVNAIYLAMEDIEALRRFAPEKTSDVLGPIKVSVTMIKSGTQHNVVPDCCTWVADVRTTDAYTNEETVTLLRDAVSHSTLTPRSTRVHASVIGEEHPLVRAAMACGGTPFVSPTTSDMALMHGIPSLKIGPGESSRSHTADEYVTLGEINDALLGYADILARLKL
ncbi:MAG: M20/M25/M40 family metallo-hydrolase [Muribaculaceae bacterium]|nr:M20/M25/M40 family metallo-hydrolase [Muribaculaceae bacterium]